MRKVFWLITTLLFFAILVFAQDHQKEAERPPQTGPCDAAMTQLDLNQCYGEQSRKADAHLNKVYASVLEQMHSEKNETAIQKLKAVEKACLQYRDLHCDAARYEYQGGSISPTVWAQCMALTTQHRIEEIKSAYETGERRLD